MEALRTPDERFARLPDYPFEPHYNEVPDGEGGRLRIHHVDEGPEDAPPVLCLHGEPSWSFLYRHMIPIFAAEGLRSVAPDLVGFGRSDKPTKRTDYSYQHHMDWMRAWLAALDLREITLVCQDWGSLLGLRLAAENPERFARIVLANGGLPTGEAPPGDAFQRWLDFSQRVPELPVGQIVSGGCAGELTPAVVAAYDAPFPDESFKEGARAFPALVPISPDDPAVAANQRAWEVLRKWQKPFLTAFSDGDPMTRRGAALFQEAVPGAKGQPHTTIVGGGHFLQETHGPELARVTLDFIRRG